VVSRGTARGTRREPLSGPRSQLPVPPRVRRRKAPLLECLPRD
jgi:hypothetical protein